MKRTHRKGNERAALVKQSDQAELDEDGYERTGPHADVIFTLEAGVIASEAGGRGRFWLKLISRAPAGSPLGITLATVPLCLILSVPAFVMAAVGFLFVKIPLITAGLALIGFAGSMWFTSRLMRQLRSGALPSSPVIKAKILPSATRTSVVLPEPETGTPAP